MIDLHSFAYTLNTVVGGFCLIIGVIGLLRPVHPRFDQIFGLLLVLLGIFYLGRAQENYLLIQLSSATFPLLTFALLSRLFRLRSSPRVRAALLFLSFALVVTAFYDKIRSAPGRLWILFAFELLAFGSLISGARTELRRAKNDYERKLQKTLFFWLGALFVWMLGDWICFLLKLPPMSATLVLPFAYWIIFQLSSGAFRSYRAELKHFSGDIALIGLLVAIVMGLKPQAVLKDAIPLGLIFFSCFVGYRILRLRSRLLQINENHWQSKRWLRRVGSEIDQLPRILSTIPGIESVRLVDEETWKELKLDAVVDELRDREEPALKPIGSLEWSFVEALPDWLRDAFLFAWESLGSELIVYLPRSRHLLAIQFQARTLDPDARAELRELGLQLLERF